MKDKKILEQMINLEAKLAWSSHVDSKILEEFTKLCSDICTNYYLVPKDRFKSEIKISEKNSTSEKDFDCIKLEAEWSIKGCSFMPKCDNEPFKELVKNNLIDYMGETLENGPK